MQPEATTSAGAERLNPLGCLVKSTTDRGRGVYASRFIPRNTIIEISPVLLFSKKEYEAHGKYTLLDHYTFIWTEGRMALALGLGSLFNHTDPPNVSYIRDANTESIKYVAARDIEAGEELCIFYGQNLWFSPAGQLPSNNEADLDDGWGGLSAVEDNDGSTSLNPSTMNPYIEGDPEEIIPEEDLPFVRFKLPPEEEEPHTIRTTKAWVVDVADPRLITTLLKWIKQAGLEGPELGHLKRIRKHEGTTTLLLSMAPEPPQLPKDLNLPDPYLLSVPSSSALTLPSLNLKSELWPTMYTPRRKDEPEPWTRHKLRWAWDAMKKTVDTAINAQAENDELPVAAHIPTPYVFPGATEIESSALSFLASDTRRSTHHPLRHSSINAIRYLADYRASQDPRNDRLEKDAASSESSLGEPQNGTNYLLTDRTFFVTHEPCIMCSMALLHSRVKEVVYLYPMPLTGGCGGSACLPTLKGVNHRFSIMQWKLGSDYAKFSNKTIEIDAKTDA
ncbi:SET domain-containing protein 7 [Psilocybe cubensis]|uniref:SET domain-containing protein 7 n=2 Tax=Psilocybe cubensis TaxID=181762 RepID=A0ACB8GZW8_PSICU|nr:SET domain-containing protein 7 [Psilocybe cubensis]KAH9480500.1 SET domain-containing protein 7 [Psilocybe cubensis]